MRMRFWVFVLAFILCGVGSARASDGTPVLNDGCETLGLTKMAADHTGIMACVLTTANTAATTCSDGGGCVWRPMSVPPNAVTVNYSACVFGTHSGYNVAGPALGIPFNTKWAAQLWCPKNYVLIGINYAEVDSVICCKLDL